MTAPMRRSAILAILGLLLWQAPAAAHHAMAGSRPQTFLQGLLSGGGHPVIGLDHLAVGVGVLAGFAGRCVLLAFSVALSGGAAAAFAA